MKIEVSSFVWDMNFCSLVQIYTTFSKKYVVFVPMIAFSEDRGSRALRNFGKFLLGYTASHPPPPPKKKTVQAVIPYILQSFKRQSVENELM
jgi:hypothetical protein